VLLRVVHMVRHVMDVVMVAVMHRMGGWVSERRAGQGEGGGEGGNKREGGEETHFQWSLVSDLRNSVDIFDMSRGNRPRLEA
jgi:hypothetical protein